MNFRHSDIVAATPDFLAAKMGLKPVSGNPLSDVLTYHQVITSYGESTRPRSAIDTDFSVILRGLKSKEFSRELSAQFTRAAVDGYQATAEHNAFCAHFSVENFLPHQHLVTVSDAKYQKILEQAPAQRGYVQITQNMDSATLASYAKIITLSVQALTGAELADFAKLFWQAGTAAAQLEASLLAGYLESSPTLFDGEPVFNSDNTTTSDFSVPALGGAMSLLRKRPTEKGALAATKATNLIVSPELELPARIAVVDAGLDIRVTVMSDLPSQRWYLTGEKESADGIGLLRLADTKNPVSVEAKKAQIEIDGIMFKCNIDTAPIALGRSIVKGGA